MVIDYFVKLNLDINKKAKQREEDRNRKRKEAEEKELVFTQVKEKPEDETDARRIWKKQRLGQLIDIYGNYGIKESEIVSTYKKYGMCEISLYKH